MRSCRYAAPLTEEILIFDAEEIFASEASPLVVFTTTEAQDALVNETLPLVLLKDIFPRESEVSDRFILPLTVETVIAA